MFEDTQPLPGMLIIASGPSGAGKNSVFTRVLELQAGKIEESISCTTRDPRPGEVEGRDYFFLSDEEFDRRVGEGFFLEYNGHFKRKYGTPMGAVVDKLRQGIDMLLVIDVQGAKMARERMPEALSIFIMPAGDTLETMTAQLTSQLTGRGHESEEKVRHRLERAEFEIDQAQSYQHVVINAPGELDRAVAEVNELIDRARRERRAKLVESGS